MNEQEINFLTRQSIEKAGFEPEFLNEATTVFINLHQSELQKINYSQEGLEVLSASIDAWKETSTGKRFLPVATNEKATPTQGDLKEIVKKFQSGELKFQGY